MTYQGEHILFRDLANDGVALAVPALVEGLREHLLLPAVCGGRIRVRTEGGSVGGQGTVGYKVAEEWRAAGSGQGRTPHRHTRSTERAHTSRATKRRWSAKTACTLGFRDTPRARNRIWSAMTACTLLRSLLAGCPPLPARQPVSVGTARAYPRCCVCFQHPEIALNGELANLEEQALTLNGAPERRHGAVRDV